MAYNMAYDNLGLTYPNPSVGAVIVKDGRVIGKAVTSSSGGSHAELLAINNALEDVKGADLYVTLEPCNHQGKNPPCCNIILSSGIKRVFYSFIDPNPLVSGLGIKALQNHGVECCKLEATGDGLYEGFFSKYNRSRPFVTLKLATSLDMKVALQDGSSKWITGESSRRYGHYLRRVNDITLAGVNTILEDDPSYNCRLDDKKSTHLAILDSHLRVSNTAKIFEPLMHEKIIIFYDDQLSDFAKLASFDHVKNVELVGMPKDDSGIDLPGVLNYLANHDYCSVLIESGSRLASSFIQSELVDLFYIFSANKILGRDGINAFDILSPEKLINCRNLSLVAIETLGQDNLRILKPVGYSINN